MRTVGLTFKKKKAEVKDPKHPKSPKAEVK